jgi:phage shock protein PspC (stress-responsive transcriptional regulator)
MNKTVTTNIGGFIFHIDDIAYEKLSQYLNTIKGYFKQSEGRDEIIGDIEARIAEMFREKTGNTKQVVTMKDVDEVIAVMGQPEAFAGEGDASGSYSESASSAAENETARKGRRRIFRDPDEKVLGGVCSGISSYFNIDPIILRGIFAISFFVFGSGFLLYLILWIIIPKAKTTADKLEMRGESVNVHNIEKNIREEMNDLKERLNNLSGEAKDLGRKDGKIRTGIHDVLDFIATIFRMLFKAFTKIIGFVLLVIGLGLLILVVASLLGLPGYVSVSESGAETRMALNELMYHFAGSPELNSWATIGAILVICIPLLGLVFAGVKIIFNIKTRNRVFSWIMSGLWTTGVMISIFVAIKMFKDFKVTGIQKDNYTVTKPKTAEVLYLNLNNNFSDIEDQSAEVADWMVYSDDEESKLFRKVELDIQKSNTDSIELEVALYAKGPSRKDATGRAGRIIYSHELNDSLLTFDKYMQLEQGDKWRFQDVKMILHIPVGQTIYLNKEMKSIIYDIDNVTNTWDSDMVNRRWKMTQNGLACVDCDNLKNIDSDNDWDSKAPELPETPEAPELTAPPAPPATEQKTHHKTEATVSDSGVTREQYDQLSKLNRMYLELKYPETNLVL